MPDGPNSPSNRTQPSSSNGQMSNGATVIPSSTSMHSLDIPHISDRFIPISHIVAALARTAYQELRQLRGSLTEASDQKRKKRIVDYAAKMRGECVKLLVLISWASRTKEVSTTIDLRSWLQGQKNCFRNSYGVLRYDIVKSLEAAKMKEPDLPTAIDVLTTGTIQRFRRRSIAKQFRPAEALDQRQIIATLQTLSSLISLRLLLHETLPLPMQDYSVANGRVTFTVPNEFSVDLFFATDDISNPNLQWFMIDFAFVFSESDHLETPMSLKLEIEGISNDLMVRTLNEVTSKTKFQLVELYSFLHRFTTQYKLERLFNQFSILGSLEKGRIDLKYASAQKVLVVGYWLQKRHRDNRSVLNSLTVTIEPTEAPASEGLLMNDKLVMDYNRDKLVVKIRLADEEDYLHAVDVSQIGAVTLLSIVLQNRIRSILEQIYQRLCQRDLTYTRTSTKLRDSTLEIQIHSNTFLTVTIEEFNGDFVVQLHEVRRNSRELRMIPAVESLQTALNASILPREHAYRIHEFKFSEIKLGIETKAQAAGWSLAKMSLTSLIMDEFGRAFGFSDRPLSPNTCIFLNRAQEGWKDLNNGSSWFVVIIVQARGLQIWVAEFIVDESQSKWRVQWTECLQLGQLASQLIPLDESSHLSFAFFERLWRLSTARIISLQLSRGLGDRNINHRYVPAISEPTWTTLVIPSITFAAEDITRSPRPWTGPLVTVDLLSLCQDESGGAIVSFSSNKIAGQQFDLSQCGDIDIQANPQTQHFLLNFKASVAQPGSSVVDNFCRKWQVLENTVQIVDCVCSMPQDFELKLIGSASVTIAYGSAPYIMQIDQCIELNDPTVSLVVSLASTTNRANPHLRISKYLTPLATRAQKKIRSFFRLVSLTLSLLEAFNTLEQDTFTNPEVYIMVRSCEEYRVYYTNKLVALLLRARPAPKVLPDRYQHLSEQILWHVTDATMSSSSPISNQRRITSCDKVFQDGLNQILQTDQTFPEGSGIGATPAFAAQIFLEVHKTIMSSQPNVVTQTRGQVDPDLFSSSDNNLVAKKKAEKKTRNENSSSSTTSGARTKKAPRPKPTKNNNMVETIEIS